MPHVARLSSLCCKRCLLFLARRQHLFQLVWTASRLYWYLLHFPMPPNTLPHSPTLPAYLPASPYPLLLLFARRWPFLIYYTASISIFLYWLNKRRNAYWLRSGNTSEWACFPSPSHGPLFHCPFANKTINFKKGNAYAKLSSAFQIRKSIAYFWERLRAMWNILRFGNWKRTMLDN